ncbi:MAG: nucleotidyltransferase family protein [Elusimicrobia bacterium]|nr:nucleotidyltransferase family protein [Elusimicrobiota bacterium]
MKPAQPEKSNIVRLLRRNRARIIRLAARYGASDVRIFGSVARGDPGRANDLDLLVRMEPGRGLLDLVGLWQDLEEFLGVKVDLITDGGVSPHLRDRIYGEAISL